MGRRCLPSGPRFGLGSGTSWYLQELDWGAVEVCGGVQPVTHPRAL